MRGFGTAGGEDWDGLDTAVASGAMTPAQAKCVRDYVIAIVDELRIEIRAERGAVCPCDACARYA